MKTKQTIHSLRLVMGAIQAEDKKIEIAPEFVPQIAAARADVALMRASDVIDALVILQRSEIPLALNVQRQSRSADEKLQRHDRR